MTFIKGDEKPRRGWARMKQIAEQNQLEAAALKEGLIASLGRSATPMETIQAEQIGILIIKIRRKIEHNRDPRDEQALMAQIVAQSPWLAQPAA